ncbi:hypothetical protein [Devosia sp. 1635]|uniref:hypothetical protein n=1 Tax=Devosia sp. 1635 TaxID=2726066 RepID=UPI0015642A00|nr:hypothetical protein [Devosia sp. 1635]
MKSRPLTAADRRARADALRHIVRSGQPTADVSRLLAINRSTINTVLNGARR